jgi:hypothetical protein
MASLADLVDNVVKAMLIGQGTPLCKAALAAPMAVTAEAVEGSGGGTSSPGKAMLSSLEAVGKVGGLAVSLGTNSEKTGPSVKRGPIMSTHAIQQVVMRREFALELLRSSHGHAYSI